MIRFAFSILFVLTFLIVLSCGEASKPANVAVNSVNKEPVNTPLPAATIDELASGKKLYATNCANCHKEDGTGGVVEIEGKKIKPDDLTSAKIKGFSDDKILGYVMNGIEDEGMPAFKGKLSEGEMRDILKYVRAEIQKMPAPSGPKSNSVANDLSAN